MSTERPQSIRRQFYEALRGLKPDDPVQLQRLIKRIKSQSIQYDHNVVREGLQNCVQRQYKQQDAQRRAAKIFLICLRYGVIDEPFTNHLFTDMIHKNKSFLFFTVLDDAGLSPPQILLVEAMRHNRPEIANGLIRRGVDITAPIDARHRPRQQQDAFPDFYDDFYVPLRSLRNFFTTPITYSILLTPPPDVSIMLNMIENGVDCNQPITDGVTLLMLAASSRNRARHARALIERSRGNLDAQCDNHMTALHHAIAGCNHVIVQELLEHGANVNLQVNIDGIPLNYLMYLVEQRHTIPIPNNDVCMLKIAVALRRHGIDINAIIQDDMVPFNHYSALSFAIRHNDIWMQKLLLGWGATIRPIDLDLYRRYASTVPLIHDQTYLHQCDLKMHADDKKIGRLAVTYGMQRPQKSTRGLTAAGIKQVAQYLGVPKQTVDGGIKLGQSIRDRDTTRHTRTGASVQELIGFLGNVKQPFVKTIAYESLRDLGHPPTHVQMATLMDLLTRIGTEYGTLLQNIRSPTTREQVTRRLITYFTSPQPKTRGDRAAFQRQLKQLIQHDRAG